ncbi:hypothetical protein ACFV2D_00900 [Streptomyces capillispiralis]|uniref:hypothetical protein n=1 Tax=Streptomyces capillispiralis TaxID=68182 RepID=UPI00368061C2
MPRHPEAAPHTPLRNALSATLVALACLLTPCGALAAWATFGLADTGRYVSTVAPLATDPAVRDAVAAAVSDEVVRELNLAPEPEPEPEANPIPDPDPDPDPDPATVSAHPTLAPFVHDAIRSFTRTEAFRTAWEAGNRAVHDAVLHALRDDTAPRGPVTVDLAPVIAQVRHHLVADRMPFADRIPVEHTEVAVVPAGELAGLRKGYHVLDTAAFWLPLTAVVLAVTGIAVAACRRRALTATGLGTALGGALLALAVALGRRLTLADLPERLHRPAAAAVYDALTATLRTASWLLLALGLTVALASWLTTRRPHRPQPLTHPTPSPTPTPVDAPAPSPRTGV